MKTILEVYFLSDPTRLNWVTYLITGFVMALCVALVRKFLFGADIPGEGLELMLNSGGMVGLTLLWPISLVLGLLAAAAVLVVWVFVGALHLLGIDVG